MQQVGQTRPGWLGEGPLPGTGVAAGAAAASAGSGPTAAGTSPAAFIEETVKGSRAAVFSKVICPSSRKAKEILSSHLPPGGMAVVELDQRPDGAALQDELEQRTGKRTVPVVFLNGEFVGGADDLGVLESSGQLALKLGA